jgi:hypothetical protein
VTHSFFPWYRTRSMVEIRKSIKGLTLRHAHLLADRWEKLELVVECGITEVVE